MAEEEGNEFNQLMVALGSVVVMWGMVEDMVRNFLRDVIMEDAEAPEIEQIVLSETSLRSQLDIILSSVRRTTSSTIGAASGIMKSPPLSMS